MVVLFSPQGKHIVGVCLEVDPLFKGVSVWLFIPEQSLIDSFPTSLNKLKEKKNQAELIRTKSKEVNWAPILLQLSQG